MAEFNTEALEERLRLATRLISKARKEWLEENDPQDGTDVVTPYDEWFHLTPLEKSPQED